jgi:hypothetical protein
VVPKFRNYLVFCHPFQETIMVLRVLYAAQHWTRFFPASQNPPAQIDRPRSALKLPLVAGFK